MKKFFVLFSIISTFVASSYNIHWILLSTLRLCKPNKISENTKCKQNMQIQIGHIYMNKIKQNCSRMENETEKLKKTASDKTGIFVAVVAGISYYSFQFPSGYILHCCKKCETTFSTITPILCILPYVRTKKHSSNIKVEEKPF